MEFLWCPKCGNSIFKEVLVLLTECRKIVAGTKIQPDGRRESAGEIREVSKPSVKTISYVCERCGDEYVLQGSSLIPAWL